MAKGSRYVDIIIDSEGKIQAESFGYKGKGCAEDIDNLLNDLGQTSKSKKKKDYYDKQKVKINKTV